MQTKFKRHSMRKIKRAIREKKGLTRNTCRSLSVSQMKVTIQYLIIAMLRENGYPKAMPSDFLDKTCGDLEIGIDNLYDAILGRLIVSFGYLDPCCCRANDEMKLSKLIDGITNVAVSEYENQRRFPEYILV